MKRITLYILLSLPLFTFGQNSTPEFGPHYLNVNSYISIEADDLNTNFLNTMLYGGFITDEMKNNWVNSGDKTNRINAELTNGFGQFEFSRHELLQLTIARKAT